MSHRSAALAPQVVLDVLSELTPLISDADLHLAHLALVLVKAAVTATPAVAMGAVDEMLLPRALALLTSSLLQANITLNLLLTSLTADGTPPKPTTNPAHTP